jgi:hypothetical protein
MHRAVSPAPWRCYRHRAWLAAVALLALVSACEDVPTEEKKVELPATVQLRFTGQSQIWPLIQTYQIHILEGATVAGEVVSCSDFPGRYRTEPLDPRLRVAYKAVNVANKWKNPPSPAQLNTIDVPPNKWKRVLIVIKGLAQTQKGPLTVARGCESFTVKAGSNKDLTIDIWATTGAPCLQQEECELTLSCHSGPKLPGGYCARTPCSSDASCPPGTLCASDTEGGTTMCMRSCKSTNDCDTSYPQAQACEGRHGAGGKCLEICVHPFWNKSSVCTP